MFGDLGRGRLRHKLEGVSIAWKSHRKRGIFTAFTELVELLEGLDGAALPCDDCK